MVCHFLHVKIVIEYSLVLEGIALCLNSSHNTKSSMSFPTICEHQNINTDHSKGQGVFTRTNISLVTVELSFSISKTS